MQHVIYLIDNLSPTKKKRKYMNEQRVFHPLKKKTLGTGLSF
jgi:hypothetical protein